MKSAAHVGYFAQPRCGTWLYALGCHSLSGTPHLHPINPSQRRVPIFCGWNPETAWWRTPKCRLGCSVVNRGLGRLHFCLQPPLGGVDNPPLKIGEYLWSSSCLYPSPVPPTASLPLALQHRHLILFVFAWCAPFPRMVNTKAHAIVWLSYRSNLLSSTWRSHRQSNKMNCVVHEAMWYTEDRQTKPVGFVRTKENKLQPHISKKKKVGHIHCCALSDAAQGGNTQSCLMCVIKLIALNLKYIT